jgi:drug/metabolite transporter (DMT)-like permease
MVASGRWFCISSRFLTYYCRRVLTAFVTTILFSISAICGHRSAKLIGGTEANFWRVTFGALCLGTWAYTLGVGLSGEALPIFVLSGIAGIGVGDVAYFQALPKMGPHLTLLITQCLTPPMSALIEWRWLGTTLTAGQILCGTIVLGGVGLALMPGKGLKLGRRELVRGALYCVLSAAAGALGAVLSRKAYAVSHAAGQPIDGANAAFQRVTGGLLVGGFCLLFVKRRAWRLQSNAPHHLVVETSKRKWRGVWLWIVLNSLAGQTIGVSLMQRALETTPTGIVLAIIAITPIMVIPLAFVFEGERPTLHALVGGAIAVAGVIGLIFAK